VTWLMPSQERPSHPVSCPPGGRSAGHVFWVPFLPYLPFNWQIRACRRALLICRVAGRLKSLVGELISHRLVAHMTPLLPVRAREQLVPIGRNFFDLVLKVASLLPIDAPACFVSTGVQLEETIGHLHGKSTFFRLRHYTLRKRLDATRLNIVRLVKFPEGNRGSTQGKCSVA
jgi:hypothetical protein